MDLQLTDEQQMAQKVAAEFAKNEVLPKAAEIDREHRHPRELVARMGELGFMGIAIPEEFGGAGLDTVSYALVLEEISRACASTGVIMSVNNSLVCDPINKFGTEEQKRTWLTPLAQGRLLGCFALSEPEAGSDAAAQKTIARPAQGPDGEGFIINGVKNWITNGPVADVCVLICMSDPPGRDQGHKAITAFILPMNTPGVRTGPPDKKLGIRGSQSCQIFLDDVFLPKSQLLGEVGQGFKVAMTTLDGGRIGIASQALGIGRAAYEDAGRYALERKTFGQPIANHQSIQWKLADMATELDAARLLTLRAATLKDRGIRHSKEAAMAKLFASEVANRAAKEGVQIFGGNGYVEDFPAERHYRDAKITEIYEGTSEIQRLVIAGAILKE
ncbi:MAG TPA: acyl-CoA dehydrogenase [Pseudomonadota bacterium]|nr:acyl-CoA dehydrogenase [Pseudomonadota bacterium]